MTKGAYISPAITDPALKETLLSFADEIEASGLTIANVDPDASLKARGGRLYYNAATDNLFIFSDDTGNYQPVSAGEEKTYHTVRIYWQRESSAGSTIPAGPPVVTLTWANLTQASTNAAYKGGLVLDSSSPSYVSTNSNAEDKWSETPPQAFSGSTFTIYWSDLTFQRTGAEATTTTTGTTPVKHIHFDGLVTFSNQSIVSAGQTSINGGTITTGTLNANKIVAGSIETDKMSNNSITHTGGFTHNLTTLNNNTFSSSITVKSGVPTTVIFLGHYTIFGTVNSSSALTRNISIDSTLGQGVISSGSSGVGGIKSFGMTKVYTPSSNSCTVQLVFSSQANITNPQVQAHFTVLSVYK